MSGDKIRDKKKKKKKADKKNKRSLWYYTYYNHDGTQEDEGVPSGVPLSDVVLYRKTLYYAAREKRTEQQLFRSESCAKGELDHRMLQTSTPCGYINSNNNNKPAYNGKLGRARFMQKSQHVSEGATRSAAHAD